MNTIASVKETYLKKMTNANRSPQTIKTYKNQINGFNSFVQAKYNIPLDIIDIKVDDVEEYIYELKNNQLWKTNSINLVISTLNGFFKYAEKKKFVNQNIMDEVEQFRKETVEKDFLTEEEMTELIKHVNQPLVKLIVTTLAYTGLRISECLNLRLDNVDFDKHTIYVIEGKGGKNREVPMPKKLEVMLKLYTDTERPEVSTNYFFALKKTGSISQQYVNRELKEATERAGIPKNVSAHTLRHSYASALVRKGTNLPTVAKLLGHADFRTVTSVYVHLADDELSSAVSQLSI